LHEVSISLLQRVNGAEVGGSEQCRWRLEALGMVPEAHWRLDLANAH
jgi:Fe2+ transport system protein FeoA